jgi:hypothetical protein
MNAKNPTFWISACVVALLAEPGVTQAQMRRREESINDVPIRGPDRKFHWLASPRPADHGASPNSGSEAPLR